MFVPIPRVEAGVSVQRTCGTTCIEVLQGWVEADRSALFPLLDSAPEKVKPKALQYAFATSASGQTPVHILMDGDELGAEFVFVRKP